MVLNQALVYLLKKSVTDYDLRSLKLSANSNQRIAFN